MVTEIQRNNRPCVLAVDDDRLLLAMMSIGIRKAGYDILQAHSAEEALQIMQTCTPDLALLDISLPGMSGLELARHLRQETDIPFMFLSSHESTDAIRQATQYGALGYLLKPLKVTHLIPAIEAGLTRAEEIRELRCAGDELTSALSTGREATDLMRSELERLIDQHTEELNRLNFRLEQAQKRLLETKAEAHELLKLANEDKLTTLPNRNWLMSFLPSALERANTTGSMLALLFLDLDGFKKVNDTLGHQAGDELLHAAALRMKSALKPTDSIARHGGDEFVVVIEQVKNESDASHVAHRMAEVLKNPFELSRGRSTVGASIGISLFPRDGKTADELLHKSDLALYCAKAEGKGHYRFYSQEIPMRQITLSEFDTDTEFGTDCR